MKILVTGSAGFIGGYVVGELLAAGYKVVGIDNYSKYGKIRKKYDDHPDYRFVEGDCKDLSLMEELATDCHQIVACASMIGGIAYFHKYAYDLLAENERIVAVTFDMAIKLHKAGRLGKINILSSSMVFENASTFPTLEDDWRRIPPPSSTYGFQKLAAEYFARGAYEQHGLPYTIIRPFNCVGVGEGRGEGDGEILSGNIKLAMSHVLPDLAQKSLKGQKPLRIFGDGRQIRCYTHGSDIARGIRLCIESPRAVNTDFNLSTSRSTTVLELAKMVWQEVNGDAPFEYVCDPPFRYDVRKRVPSTEKAERLLGFRAQAPLEESVREVVDWMRQEVAAGRI